MRRAPGRAVPKLKTCVLNLEVVLAGLI